MGSLSTESDPGCRHPRAGASGEAVCPACLFAAAADPENRVFVGSYELLQAIGEGGMGTVYVAKHVDEDHLVALKIAKADLVTTPEGIAAFRREIRTASALVHPHLVRVYTSGTHQGRPFFVMELFDGGTLADEDNRQRLSSARQALDVVLKVARAVQFAQQSAILHCDIKPENILLGQDGELAVADFGLARAPEDGEGLTEPSFVGGTIGWMSPEQVDGQRLTTASDVFSLGVLLHWLLTGDLPFGAGDDFAERLRNAPPAAAGRLPKGLAAELREISAKAMEKAPGRRYGTAKELADDLQAARDRRPTSLDQGHPWRRLIKRVRHRPLPVLVAATVMALLLATAGVAISVARTQEDELRADVLRVNAYAARALSGAVLFELRKLADALSGAAAHPTVHDLLMHPKDEKAIANWRARDIPQGFNTTLLLDANCRWIARKPVSPNDRPGEPFDWRDYCARALRMGLAGKHGVQVSRGYTSVADETTRFGLITPAYDAEGAFVGVVSAAVTTATAMGDLVLTDSSEPDRIAVVVARRDRDHPGDRLPEDWMVLLHSDVKRGSRHRMPGQGALAALRGTPDDPLEATSDSTVTDDNHRDPIPGFEGRWLAGVSPVGGTPFAVIVQTRYQTAVGANQRLTRNLMLGAGVALAAVLLVSAVVLLVARALRTRG